MRWQGFVPAPAGCEGCGGEAVGEDYLSLPALLSLACWHAEDQREEIHETAEVHQIVSRTGMGERMNDIVERLTLALKGSDEGLVTVGLLVDALDEITRLRAGLETMRFVVNHGTPSWSQTEEH